MTTFSARSRNLGNDQDGAILLVGIFMCCVLASLIWYMAGITQALVWHDRGQEVADSLALTSASCHARGMNFISFLNLVMLLVATVFVLLRVIDYLLMFLAMCVFTWVPYTQSLITPTWNLHEKVVSKAASKLEKMMEKTFPYAGRLQQVVAVAAPLWGGVSSSFVSAKYQDFGKNRWGGSLSISMVPLDYLTRLQRARPNRRPNEPEQPGLAPDPSEGGAALDRWMGQTEQYSRWAAGQGGYRQFIMPQDLMGRQGLPVTADKFNSLCTASISVLPDLAYQFMKDNIGAIANMLDNPFIKNGYTTMVRMTTYGIKEMACNSPFWKSGQYTPPDPRSEAQVSVNPQCSMEQIKKNDLLGSPPDPGRGPPNPGPAPSSGGAELDRWLAENEAYSTWVREKKEPYDNYNNRAARNQRLAKAQEECKKNGQAPYTPDDVIAAQKKNRDLGPKLMVTYALNGNDWMQVWGVTWGDPPADGDARQVMQAIPKVMKETVSDAPSVGRASSRYWAQAEFYLDCYDRWFSACNNFSLATFKLGWRARLRRVKHPDYVADVLTMIVGSLFASDWMRDRFRAAVPVAADMTRKLPNWFANVGFATLKSEVLYETNLLVGHGSFEPRVLH
ncbi:MAG: hypothetical protein QM756_15905 [Polyangiaceae bacterium]